MAITMVKVRARITIGNLIVETPFIRSFTVSKSRGQVSTFNAVLKVPHDEFSSNLAGSNIFIEAGEDTPQNRIFTGVVKQAKISPCWDDPYYVDLSVSGADCLSNLQGKKYTRRCRSTRASWVAINSVVRAGLKSGKFKYIEDPVVEITPDDPVQREHVTFANKTKVPEPPKSPDAKEIPIKAKGLSYTTTGEES
jgi:hypothetical protein